MAAPSSSQRTPGSAGEPRGSSPWTSTAGFSYYRPFRSSGSDTRVSDTERSEIADLLAKHYADGRLDQVEFNERVDQAMKAKTRADFRGLLDDLPDLADHRVRPDLPGTGAPMAARYRRPRYGLHRVLFLAFIVAVTVFVANAIAHNVILWLVIGLVAFLILREGASRRRRS